MAEQSNQNRVTKSALTMTFVSIISLVFSFVQESVFAYFFGASSVTDAYTVASQIPMILFSLVSTAISTVVIPCYSKEYYEDGPRAAEKYASNFTTVISGITIIFITLCEIFANQLIFLFAPGMDAVTRDLAVEIFRIILPTVLCTEIMNINTGILNVHKKFVLPALTSNLLNVAFVTTIAILAGKYGIFAAVIGFVIGSALELIYSVVLRRTVMKYHFILDLKDKTMIKSFKMAFPVFAGIGAAEINKVVDRMVSSFLEEGSISTLNYASKLSSAVSSLMIAGITTVVYPEFAKSSAKKDDEGMANMLLFSTKIIMLLIVPVIFGGALLSKELIKIIFCRGAFTLEAVDKTAPLFACYLVCLLFTSFRQTSSRVFYSYGDSKTPMINSMIGIAINIVLNIVLGYFIGALGLALATTISTAVISILLLASLKKKNGYIKYRSLGITFIKVILASSVMTAIILLLKWIVTKLGWYDYNLLLNNVVFAIVSVIIGILSYFVVLLLLRTSEISEIINMFNRRKNK